MAEASNCEMCNNFVYDDEDECYMVRFLMGNTASCPYYQSNDEYLIVRHQM